MGYVSDGVNLMSQEEVGSSIASELNLSNVGGVFVGRAMVALVGGHGRVLGMGIARRDKIPLLGVLASELRFVFKCRGSSKPVRKKVAESEAAGNNIYGSDVYNYSSKNTFT
ncbi:hypothetical protein GWK47_043556 [Chionoecetes opilio]|uniref:Uncharacterized protein n=1 Tax=Chionoecetes opilio TaxID=41210 RepID=A0A8J4Y837_CHIOP|nr:hypothetical protein GWK47_043556 [Chionoecetes opilio]